MSKLQPAEHLINPLISILLASVGYAFFNIGDAAVKMLSYKFHFSQIIFFNCVVIIACMCIYGGIKEGRRAFRMHKPKWILARGALSVGIAILNVCAFPHIQLTTFYTLVFTSPFWVAILSAIFLGEKLEKRQIAVILAGFAVILFVFRPGSGLFSIWAVAALTGAFLYSCSMVIMRHLGPKESRTAIIVTGSILSVVFSAPFLPFHFLMPTPYEWGVFLTMGILSTIGIFCIAYAFQNAPSAATIAPYHYTQIVWGALLGYFMFNEVPSGRVILGAACIILAGLFLIYDEARMFRRKKNAVNLSRSALGQAV